MSRLPRISGKEMLRFLKKQGYTVRRVRGSHYMMEKDILCTTVPVHGSDPLKIGTLCGILREIEMNPDDFRRKFKKS